MRKTPLLLSQHSIGREAAIQLAASKWWIGLPPRSIARFQLFTQEVCCPFDVFHEALEKALGRPVFTYEFALNLTGIINEFIGLAPKPTLEEIMELIPEEKRVVITLTKTKKRK